MNNKETWSLDVTRFVASARGRDPIPDFPILTPLAQQKWTPLQSNLQYWLKDGLPFYLKDRAGMAKRGTDIDPEPLVIITSTLSGLSALKPLLKDTPGEFLWMTDAEYIKLQQHNPDSELRYHMRYSTRFAPCELSPKELIGMYPKGLPGRPLTFFCHRVETTWYTPEQSRGCEHLWSWDGNQLALLRGNHQTWGEKFDDVMRRSTDGNLVPHVGLDLESASARSLDEVRRETRAEPGPKPQGVLLPALRDKDWVAPSNVPCRPLLGETTPDGPWVSYGFDTIDSFASITGDTPGWSLEEIDRAALENLAKQGVTLRPLREGLLAVEGDYAGEAVVLLEHLAREVEQHFGAGAIVAIPEAGAVLVSSLYDERNAISLGTWAREHFENAQGRRISPLPFLLFGGRVVGFLGVETG